MAEFKGDIAHAQVVSPEAYCFLMDLATGSILRFQLMPSSIAESKSASYTEIPVVGRSLPLLGYAYSSSRQMGLSLDFVALSKDGLYTTDWVRNQVRWLEAKVYPRYLDGFTFPPPGLRLVIGNVIGMQCVMVSCSTSWNAPWAFEGRSAQPFRATVDIQLQEYGQNGQRGYPFGHDEALSGANQNLGAGVQYGAGGDVSIPIANFYNTPTLEPFNAVTGE